MIRLYYSTKVDGQSNIFFIDLDESSLDVISDPKLAMSPGNRGCFDHAGVMPSCVHRGMMYYTGWNLRRDVPYSHAIGVCEIKDTGELVRLGGSILNVNHYDQFLLNSPCVFDDGFHISMFYCSGTKWIDDFPCYSIKKARSIDGMNWTVNDCKAITFGYEDEAISRVCVGKSGILYFSMKTKNTKYKIYMIGLDGEKRLLEMPEGDWDNEMQCYPFLYERNEYNYLFYNGNGYGASGIGVAKWIEDIV